MAKTVSWVFRITNANQWVGNPPPAVIKHQVNQAFAGSRVKMLFKADYPPRSPAQNRSYWGLLITPIMEYLHEVMGHDDLNPKSDFHKRRFHRELFMTLWDDRVERLIDQKSGEVILKLAPSSSELTTVEFMAYQEQVRQWASEMFPGLTLYKPNEQGRIEY